MGVPERASFNRLIVRIDKKKLILCIEIIVDNLRKS